jgi:Fe-S-cluster containining protein
VQRERFAVTPRARWAIPAGIVAADERLVETFDAVIGEGERRAARHLTCRLGCTACCIGPFDITALDAARLIRGIEQLAIENPRAARAVRRRAAEQWRWMAPRFPGEARSGILTSDEGARAAFFARLADVPCPPLDPASGACVLYPWRPLSCRSFGVPVRFGGQTLPPCSLNFTTPTPEEIAAARVEVDPGDVEGKLLSDCEPCDTLICAALGGAAGPGKRST